jgi:DNA ligase-1
MKPMLACPAPTDGLTFPLLASVKIDGIRCVIKDGVALTRKLEVIPNPHVQRVLNRVRCMDGLDGELTVGPAYADHVFNTTQSAVMAGHGEPDFVFHVFDVWNMPGGSTYKERLATLRHSQAHGWFDGLPITVLEQRIVTNGEELEDFQMWALEKGYEGLIVRSFDSPYKHGRSTAKQGWMMKIKKFSDGEARVLGCVEMMRNQNELEVNNVGGAKRSKALAGMVPAGVLGALQVEDCVTGVKFQIGSGFDATQREQLWSDRERLLGRIVSYKHFEVGVKTAPRFPIFKGFRDARDMGEPA